MMVYDLKNRSTLLVIQDQNIKEKIEAVMTGAVLEALENYTKMENPIILLPFTNYSTNLRNGVELVQTFQDLYQVLQKSDSFITLSFVPCELNYLKSIKKKVEHELSGKEIRITRLLNSELIGKSASTQSELYYGSDERQMLLSMLNSINESMLQNGMSYRVSIAVSRPLIPIMQYLKSRVHILESFKSRAHDLPSVFTESFNIPSMPFSINHCSTLLCFSDTIKRKALLPTNFSGSFGEIALGTYVKSSVFDTGEPVFMPLQCLNLGLIVAGLPGTGKSYAAMNILNQIMSSKKPPALVISPTEEWNNIGESLDMEIIDVYHCNFHINFFKCNYLASKEKFYENLAMLMASASCAGPYQGPMEKCLLAAFRKVYSVTNDPDPSDVYYAIQDAVIERHAKRSNTGIKYTKHGENIIAALENLRQMLFKPQFAYPGGIDFIEILKKGAVFDLSSVSNSMKPFFYAMILNQTYSFADSIDVSNDDKLRMFICIEEAQLIFDNIEQSAASLDLRQRIQDFRKKGICLAILTHSVNDISVGIRRLCQTKLYFRQSTDSVKYAANDLVFKQELYDNIVDRLKTLEQRICAASYMAMSGSSKEPASPVFLKSKELCMPYKISSKTTLINLVKTVTNICVINKEEKPIPCIMAEIQYVGEKVFSGITDKEGMLFVEGLFPEKTYRLLVFGEKKRDTRLFHILGSTKNVIKL